jgi:hypothetical protein
LDHVSIEKALAAACYLSGCQYGEMSDGRDSETETETETFAIW